MEAALQNKCDQLIENYNRMLPGNRFEFNSLVVAGAAMFLARDVEVDGEKLEECRRLLKKRKGIFSNFRGVAEFIVRCRMALADDPEACLTQIDAVYKDLKTAFSDGQTLLAAMVIADLAAAEDQAAVVRKTKSIYKEMRKAHPWLTSREDMPFAALMAVTGKDSASVYEEAEKNYELLKQELRASSESRQMLSHILSIYPGHAESKCEKICRIAAGLRETRHPLARNRYISILGLMAGTSLPAEELVRRIGEADDYLKHRKPFRGIFGVGRDVRRMVAVQMTEAVQRESGPAGVPDASAVSSVISTSIEVTVVMLILMYTMIATSSAAASHS